jgi:short-subunit dehydrogenase
MNEYFNSKVVIVTGGSDGIGKALVEILLAVGAKIATCGRSIEKFDFLKTHANNNNLFIAKCDVSKLEDCETFVDAAVKKFGKIDVLVNNAGISMHGEFLDTDLSVFEQVMGINYFGSVYCTKFALSEIIKQKGSVVGISSIAGYRGLPGRSGYSASKFALNGWLEALRTEMMVNDVNVLWVSPGFTKSNIRAVALNENAQQQGESPIDESSLMTSEECAQHILNAIVKRKRTLVLTFKGKQTVFMSKFFPNLADKLTRNFFYKNGKLIK